MSAVIDVRDLLGHPGSSRQVHVSESIPNLGTQLAVVPEERPVGGDLLFESVVEGILVTGPLRGVMVLTCARCLKPFDATFDLDVQELYAPDAGVDVDEYPLAEGEVDLEPMIRDAVLLAMPFAPLHSPDCLGLCERCGGDRNLGECRCQPEVDSRWAPLLELDLQQFPDLPGEREPARRGAEPKP
jgi:uncharacterized protein